MNLRLLEDHEAPGKSFNTDIIAAWLTSGGAVVKNGGFQHFVDETGKTHVRWIVNLDVLAKIDGEQINFDEFRKRFEDLEWCKANSDSDIAWMRGYRDNARDLKRFAKSAAVGIHRGDSKSFGVVYPNSPEWLKSEFQARFA
jgi:hypothetical protein